MQPYLFPYIGYFQLVAAVDRFVFLDDVNFIKSGWINRNRLFLSGQVNWFTLPLVAASPNRKINDLHVHAEGSWRRKLLTTIRHSYSSSPYFEPTYSLVEGIVQSKESSLSVLAQESVRAVAGYLGLEAQFLVSTARYGNEDLRGPDRVLDICLQEQADQYHNLPGGVDLYSADVFSSSGVELHFVQPRLIEYSQQEKPFKPGLSILDVLMFNDREATLQLLGSELP